MKENEKLYSQSQQEQCKMFLEKQKEQPGVFTSLNSRFQERVRSIAQEDI